MRVRSQIAVVAVAAVAVTCAGLAPALADPPAGTTPALTDIVGVSSTTTQGVLDAISAHIDGTTPPPASKLYSWDTVNPVTGATGDTIITKASGPTDTTCSIARPSSASAGIAALHVSATDDGHPCIDYASSANTPWPKPAGLLYVAFAIYAVSWTTPSAGAGKPTTLTNVQLHDIYACTATKWNQVGGTSGATIYPVLPSAGSDTRAFFLGAIGVSTPGPCVVDASVNIPGDPNNPVPIEENTGKSPKDSSGNWLTGNQWLFSSHENAIFPYSVPAWISQQGKPVGGGHGTASYGPGTLLEPQQIFGIPPILTHPGPPVTFDTLNSSFTVGTNYEFGRQVFIVMPSTATGMPQYLVPIFGPKGAVCTDTTDIKSYGFGLIGSACG